MRVRRDQPRPTALSQLGRDPGDPGARRPSSEPDAGDPMDFSIIELETVATLLLLLLIGIGPKIALVPFLEKTKKFTPEQQIAIGRRMVITAVVAAVVVFITGGLLLRLLHITTGAVAVAGGIILALIAVKMALGSEEVVEHHEAPGDPDKLAVYPLAIPYLFNP